MSWPQGPLDFPIACPLPLRDYPEIVMAHGAGGAMTLELIEKMILPVLTNDALAENHDGAVMDFRANRLAFTTDSYVIHPLEFPGGNIGRLAVCGTVNDLAMCGARPQHLSLGLIIEEGLPTPTLWRIIQSIGQTCRAAQVQVVTGDTKVVDRGKGDGLFINMSGVGAVVSSRPISPKRIKVGDAVLLSGDIGRHGIAVLSAREGISFETAVSTDCAPLHNIALALLEAGLDIHCMRDLTRGGLASALVELTMASGNGIDICEAAIPVSDGVRGACELLGLDPLYIANEGRFAIILPAAQASSALEILRRFPAAQQSCQIGEVVKRDGNLILETFVGSRRQLDLLSTEHLPRIC